MISEQIISRHGPVKPRRLAFMVIPLAPTRPPRVSPGSAAADGEMTSIVASVDGTLRSLAAETSELIPGEASHERRWSDRDGWAACRRLDRVDSRAAGPVARDPGDPRVVVAVLDGPVDRA